MLTAVAVLALIVLAAQSATRTPAQTAPPPRFQVVFIDVGQGDAALITLDGQRMLIDGGHNGATIVSRLRGLGVSKLDAVVATHPDADHVGGLADVLQSFAVGRIYVNGDTSTTETYTQFLAVAAKEPGAEVVTIHRGDSVPLGSATFPVLSPGPLSGETNTDSIVLDAVCGNVSVLFTGDADTAAEQSMLAAGVVPDVDVLKAGHHGSNSSSSAPFLARAKPEVAVISAGRTNPYGHPAAAAMARLVAAGAQFEYTDTTPGNDSVTMSSDCVTYSLSPAPTDTVRPPG